MTAFICHVWVSGCARDKIPYKVLDICHLPLYRKYLFTLALLPNMELGMQEKALECTVLWLNLLTRRLTAL